MASTASDESSQSPAGETAIAVRAEGFTTVCIVPRALGYVTKLKRVGNSVVAETASGVDLLLPNQVKKPAALKFSNVGDPEKW